MRSRLTGAVRGGMMSEYKINMKDNQIFDFDTALKVIFNTNRKYNKFISPHDIYVSFHLGSNK